MKKKRGRKGKGQVKARSEGVMKKANNTLKEETKDTKSVLKKQDENFM